MKPSDKKTYRLLVSVPGLPGSSTLAGAPFEDKWSAHWAADAVREG